MSAVYPQAKAEFDTGLIRLHSSPAPVPRKTLLSVITPAGERTTQRPRLEALIGKKADLKTVPANIDEMAPDDAMKARFFDALEKRIGGAEMKGWFLTANLTAPAQEDAQGDQWILTFPTKFQAKWVSDNFIQALEYASRIAGFSKSPRIQEARAAVTS